jgi:DNA processing protein
VTSVREDAALVALLRLGRRSGPEYAELVESSSGTRAALVQELSAEDGQGTLLPPDEASMVADAARDIDRWREQGFGLVTILSDAYPQNLRAVHDRPPLIFVAGRLLPEDHRAIAVIGSRRASEEGLGAAARIADHLVEAGFTVVSGLAAGVDTAAHRTALAAGGRTLAVLGTGLAHAYPAENAPLQRRIAAEGAVISQFWPEAAPTRGSFPLRNAVMSGLALATVVVEASATSGARIQARLALGHGRPVFLLEPVLVHDWARELAARPGTHVVSAAEQIATTIGRLTAAGALVE